MKQPSLHKLKPSELILVALNDLKLCEESEAYEINMAIWHYPSKNQKKCRVCLAGAVMAQSLDTSPNDFILPHKFDHKTKRSLRALEFFRSGEIRGALRELQIEPPSTMPVYIPSREYEPENADLFHDYMNHIALILEEHDL